MTLRFLGRVFLWFIFVIVMIPAILFVVIQIRPVQNFLNSKFSEFLTQQLNTQISIGYVYYEPPYRIVLKDFLISDYHSDTLFFVKKAKFVPLKLYLKRMYFQIDRLEAQYFKFKYLADSTGYSNLDYFIDHLPASQPKEKSQSQFNLWIKKIIIRNGSFIYNTKEKLSRPMGLDFNDLDFERINLQISNLRVIDDSVSFRIQNMWAYEKSGFRVRHFSMNFTYKDALKIEKLSASLNKSQIISNSIFVKPFEGKWTDYANLTLNLDISPFSTIDIADLSYFSDSLRSFYFRLKFGINSFGQIANYKINSFVLKFANNTEVYLNGSILNAPDIKNIYFDLTFPRIYTTINDLEKISNPKTHKKVLKIPQNITLPRYINLSATIVGKINDLDLNLSVNSDLGSIKTSISYWADSLNKKVTGNLDLNEIKISKILKNSNISDLTLSDTFTLHTHKDKLKFAHNIAKINSYRFNNYDYSNIVLNTRFQNDSLAAIVKINDHNVKFSTILNLFIKNKSKSGDFKIVLDTLNFYPLHIIKDDRYASVSAAFSGSFSFQDLNSLDLKMKLAQPVHLIKNLQYISIKKFDFVTNYNIVGKDTIRNVLLNNDFVNFQANGNLRFEEISIFIQNTFFKYFPALEKNHHQKILAANSQRYFSFNMSIVNLDPLKEMFFPKIQIASNSFLKGNFNSNKNFTCTFHSDSIFASKNKLYNINFSIIADSSNLTTTSLVDSIKLSQLNLKNFIISSNSHNNDTRLTITWDNKSQVINQGRIRAFVALSKASSDKINVFANIMEDTIFIDNVLWRLSAKQIVVDSSGIFFDQLIARNSLFKQSINVNGKASKSNNDTLNIRISNFNLSQFNPLIKKAEINGNLFLNASLVSVLDTPKITLTDSIVNISINNSRVGNLYQTITFNNQTNTVTLISNIFKEQQKRDSTNLILSSNVNYNLQTKEYSANIFIRKFLFKPYEPFYKDFVLFSTMSNLNGDLKIKGGESNLKIIGDLNIFGSFLLVQTGIYYTINGGMNIKIKENEIVINKTVLVGPNLLGDATLTGSISHKNFKDPYFNIYLKVDTLPVFRANRTSDKKYYGNIFVTGAFSIKGYPQAISLKADLTTEENTVFTVILDRPSNISNRTNIVTFVDTNDLQPIDTNENTFKRVSDQNNVRQPIKLDFDVNIALNPNSKFKIYINESLNEYLEVQALGNIKLKQNPFGDLVIFGKAEIDRGLYNFVWQNVVTINRKFQIQKGSNIVFNGTPLEAVLDISTFYTVRNVSLYNLLLENTYLNTKTNADCYIKIKGLITKPEISFDVELPLSDKRITNQLKALDQNEINKQFISLLVLGRFQPLPGLSYDPEAEQLITGAFNPGEIVSNQINSLLSNLNTNIDLNLNYISGNTSTSDEFNVGLSIPLLNNRLNVSTDLGYKTNTNIDNQQNQIIGDFEATYKIDKSGNLKIKGFNRTNQLYYYEQGYTQGIGLLYHTSFDKIVRRNLKQKKDTLQNTPQP